MTCLFLVIILMYQAPLIVLENHLVFLWRNTESPFGSDFIKHF